MSSQAMAINNSTRRVLSASTITGDKVRNRAGEDLGTIEEIMLDVTSGEVAYAVISFGGFLGLGDKLFAVPWSSLESNAEAHEFLLDVDKHTLENAPGFDKDNWPDFADSTFGSQVHEHYSQPVYWERNVNARAWETGAGVRTETELDAEVEHERLNQPDLPTELKRRPIDVTDFPGRQKDADMRVADPSRNYE
jgi:sporulation protein YlmC with PRC-barrel domain